MLHGMSMCSSGRLNVEKSTSTLKLNGRVLCSRRYAVKVPVERDDDGLMTKVILQLRRQEPSGRGGWGP